MNSDPNHQWPVVEGVTENAVVWDGRRFASPMKQDQELNYSATCLIQVGKIAAGLTETGDRRRWIPWPVQARS